MTLLPAESAITARLLNGWMSTANRPEGLKLSTARTRWLTKSMTDIVWLELLVVTSVPLAKL